MTNEILRQIFTPLQEAVLNGTYNESPHQITKSDFPKILNDPREMVGNSPLTLILEDWDNERTRSFWEFVKPFIDKYDSHWIFGSGKVQSQDKRFLDFSKAPDTIGRTDKDFARAQIADLLYVSANSQEELDEILNNHIQNTWVLIVDTPFEPDIGKHDRAGLPHLRFIWKTSNS